MTAKSPTEDLDRIFRTIAILAAAVLTAFLLVMNLVGVLMWNTGIIDMMFAVAGTLAFVGWCVFGPIKETNR
jgi:hypothetical protein